jgi:hypothetical protein
VLAYVGEKHFKHFFEDWHLRLYRKQCVDTAPLYLAEIRARAALRVLLELSEATPKRA